MSDGNTEKLEPNTRFGFLYKSTNVKPWIISQITLVPEYMDAIGAYRGHIGTQELYEIIKKEFKKMWNDGSDHGIARSVLKGVSKAATGDSQTWRSELGIYVGTKRNKGPSHPDD